MLPHGGSGYVLWEQKVAGSNPAAPTSETKGYGKRGHKRGQDLTPSSPSSLPWRPFLTLPCFRLRRCHAPGLFPVIALHDFFIGGDLIRLAIFAEQLDGVSLFGNRPLELAGFGESRRQGVAKFPRVLEPDGGVGGLDCFLAIPDLGLGAGASKRGQVLTIII